MSKNNIISGMKTFINGILNSFDELMFPEFKCFLCGREVEMTELHICNDCLKEFKLIKGKVCEICGLPIEEPNVICDECKTMQFEFDVARASFIYTNKTSKLITDLKFRNKKYLAKFLAYCMSLTLKNYPMNFDYIVPVPISDERRRQRGFNQSELIADELSNIVQKPVLNNLIMRTKTTPNQKELSRVQRMKNLVRAFCVEKTKEYEGKDLLIIDDVFTTGATVNEVARMLRQLNPGSICVLTAGKTVLSANGKKKVKKKVKNSNR